MNDLIYYVLFISVTHAIVNLVEMGYFRFGVFIQHAYSSLKLRWGKLHANQQTSQPRVLELHTILPTTYNPSEGIGSEYCECLLMLSWSILFSSAFPIVSVVLTIVFLARCRLLLHCMLVLRSNMLPQDMNTSSHWFMVLKFVIVTSVFTNATILAFVSKNAEFQKLSLAFSSDSQASFPVEPCKSSFFCSCHHFLR